MVRIIFIYLTVCTTLACTEASHDQATLASTSVILGGGDELLNNKALTIIDNYCSACHGSPSSGSGGIRNILNIEHLISSGSVVPGDSTQGRLIGSIEDGSMPTSGTVAPSDLAALKQWIDAGEGTTTIIDPPVVPPVPDPVPTGTLQEQAITIISNKCAACHGQTTGGAGNISNILDIQHLIDSSLITVGDSAQGRLIGSIEDGSMPPSGTVTAEQLTILKDWIDTEVDAATSTPPVVVPLEPTFQSIFTNILQPKCVACHSASGTRKSERYEDYNSTITTGKIKPGDPQDSGFFKEMADGDMPQQKKGYAPLTQEELDVVEQWILEGAQDN